MFIIQAKQPNYCPNMFASSSCQTEFNSKMECGLSSSKGGLRRNSSNLSQLSAQDLCSADATQIEMDFVSESSHPFEVVVDAPTGERTTLQFTTKGDTQCFSPLVHGCGHGLWKIFIYHKQGDRKCLSYTDSVQLDGVGSLFFSISDDLRLRLISQEFLSMSGLCVKHGL